MHSTLPLWARRRIPHAFAAALAGLAIASCAPSSNGADAGDGAIDMRVPPSVPLVDPGITPDPGALPAVAPGQPFTLPVDAYILTSAQEGDYQRAQDALTADCMAAYGLDNEPAEARGATVLTSERRYGVFDADGAAQAGFAVPSRFRAPEQADPGRTIPWLLAFIGSDRIHEAGAQVDTDEVGGVEVKPQGCLGEAEQVLSPSDPTHGHPVLVLTLSSRAWDAAKADSRLDAAEQAWAACMSGRGYEAQEPFAFEAEHGSRAPGTAVTADEIRAATSDVECKVDSGYVQTFHELDVAYQGALIAANADALAVAAATNAATLAAVRNVLDAA